MGNWKGIFRMGLLALMLFLALGTAFLPIKIAVEDQGDDGSSGHWEGVALAHLDSL